MVIDTISRKTLQRLLAIVLIGISMAAVVLRVGRALHDAQMAMALEAISEGGHFSWLRGRIFLGLGADPDAPILYWGIKEPPLVACVDSGNRELARALVNVSSHVTWQKAVRRACDEGRERNEAMIRVLASRDAIDPEQLCAMPMRAEVR
jgi:hypothetical protein